MPAPRHLETPPAADSGAVAAPRGTVAELGAISAPIVLSRLSLTVMALVDVLLVSTQGVAAVAGVGLAVTLLLALAGPGFAGLNAVKILTARAAGSGHGHTARHACESGLLFAAGLAVIGLAISPFSAAILHSLGGSDAAAAVGGEYLRIRLLGLLPMLAANAIFSWFEGRGDTATPMRVMVAGNLANLALSPALMFGLGPLPAFGVTGAAAASVIASALHALAAGWLYRRRRPPIPPRLLGSALVDLGRLARLGGPMALEVSLRQVAAVVFVGLIAQAGTVHLAAHAIAWRVVSVGLLAAQGVGNATGVLVGQALGAGRPHVAQRVHASGRRLAVGLMLGVTLAISLAAKPLISVFASNHDVLRVGVLVLLASATFLALEGATLVKEGALEGARDVGFVLLARAGSAWFVLLPCAWVAIRVLGLGAPGAWLAMGLEVAAAAALLSFRALPGAATARPAAHPVLLASR